MDCDLNRRDDHDRDESSRLSTEFDFNPALSPAFNGERAQSGTDSSFTPEKPQQSSTNQMVVKKKKKDKSMKSMKKKRNVRKDKSKIMEKSRGQTPSLEKTSEQLPPSKSKDLDESNPKNGTSPNPPSNKNNAPFPNGSVSNCNSKEQQQQTTSVDEKTEEKVGDDDIMRGVREIMANTKARKESSKKLQIQKLERERAEQQKKKWFMKSKPTKK